MVGGAALDGDGDDLAGELIGVVLEVRLDLLDLERGVMLAFVFEILQPESFSSVSSWLFLIISTSSCVAAMFA